MDIREVDPADEADLRRHWETGYAAALASRPYDFHTPWETFRGRIVDPRADLEMVLLAADLDGAMAGAAIVALPLRDNLHVAHVEYYVRPEQQRRGLGRALAEASYGVARRRGRRVVSVEAYAPVDGTSPGLQFAEAVGFAPALVEGMKVVDLTETEASWDALAARIAPKHADYRILTWVGRVPEEHVQDVCRLNEIFLDEAPMGDLDVEPERWDADRLRARESHNARVGRHDVSAGAVAPDGTLVAVTEVAVNEHAPHRGFQSGTLVDPAHRGHRLGLAVKIANHRQLRRRFPGCRILLTGNADVNAPMNAVNEALGYREVERCLEMQRVL